ncbi:hypothetical protein BGW39_006295 [Mortierella sp. 14UC]|nr:hypothetical protein BGW39_006295 [Mortierella sp. 14UC]
MITAPTKHTPASQTLVNSMQLTFSDTSSLPLQLQIESQSRLYYLNYRPTYVAGQSTIGFWMVSPKGAQAPKTASLELFDEFGKVKLATLVKERTEVPRDVAAKGEPFLWKSWVVPKELKADFEFSEKFHVVLRTSDFVAAAPATMNIGRNDKKMMGKKVVKNDKRSSTSVASSVLNKTSMRAAPAPVKKAATVKATGGFVIVQDRQFRIKGLKEVNTANPPTTNNSKETGAASPASAANAPVISQVSGKKTSTGISSLPSNNLLLTFTVAVLLSLLGLLL